MTRALLKNSIQLKKHKNPLQIINFYRNPSKRLKEINVIKTYWNSINKLTYTMYTFYHQTFRQQLLECPRYCKSHHNMRTYHYTQSCFKELKNIFSLKIIHLKNLPVFPGCSVNIFSVIVVQPWDNIWRV